MTRVLALALAAVLAAGCGKSEPSKATPAPTVPASDLFDKQKAGPAVKKTGARPG